MSHTREKCDASNTCSLDFFTRWRKPMTSLLKTKLLCCRWNFRLLRSTCHDFGRFWLPYSFRTAKITPRKDEDDDVEISVSGFTVFSVLSEGCAELIVQDTKHWLVWDRADFRILISDWWWFLKIQELSDPQLLQMFRIFDLSNLGGSFIIWCFYFKLGRFRIFCIFCAFMISINLQEIEHGNEWFDEGSVIDFICRRTCTGVPENFRMRSTL